jgi:hypothetical protein
LKIITNIRNTLLLLSLQDENETNFMRKFRPHNYDHCLNCDTPMTEEARFCSQCSQPRTDGKHSVWVLIRDFIESTFNLDARFLRTLYRLLNPAAL